MNPSRFMTQLKKEKRNTNNVNISEERIQDIFAVLSKMEPKNLMLSQLLIFLIEKGFIKNSENISLFMETYDEIKYESVDTNIALSKVKVQEQEKFTKQKFIKYLKKIANKIYPGNPSAFETFIYNRIIAVDDDHRLKIDDVVKKFLTKQSVTKLKQYNMELQIIFQVYLPQNFNSKMNFNWEQIRFLQKKIPILSVFRFLWEVQIVPQFISPTQFLQVVSKLIPPLNSNHKEVMFYYPETINNYVRDSINLKCIKVLDGDLGLSYFQFQMLIARIAIEFAREIKNDCIACFQKFFSFIKLKESIIEKGQAKGKQNKFEESLKMFYENEKGSHKSNFQPKKRQTKKKIEEILQSQNFNESQTKNLFKETQATAQELFAIKKNLDDDQLPVIPPKPQIEKENDEKYNINSKHIVIGEQLPKLQQKNKPAAPKKNEKKDENLNKFKFEEEVIKDESSDHYSELIKKPKKMRLNNEFPIILTQTLYPNDISNIYINPKAEIFLETTYIYLGEKQYQNAFLNFSKAKMICQPKTPSLQFYFELLEAQIYESAGRDSISLIHYNKAKDIVMASSKDKALMGYAFRGIGCCLYHLQQYEYAFRCFSKVKEIREKDLVEDSVENAILQNNIGCCFMMLNRHSQAMRNFKVSECIFDLRVNKLNEKTLVVQQNAMKNKKAYIELVPSFKTMWKTYEQKPTKNHNSGKPVKKK